MPTNKQTNKPCESIQYVFPRKTLGKLERKFPELAISSRQISSLRHNGETLTGMK